MVKRRGGLILSWTGARVELPQGAAGGGSGRWRVISAPLPAMIRAYACPWLGPNLRLGSDIQLLWCPSKLRKPVVCFIPFSYATAMELTTPEATQKAEEAYAEKGIWLSGGITVLSCRLAVSQILISLFIFKY